MTPIYKKSLGVDEATGLEHQIVVNQFTVDTEAEKVIIIYRLELLSPKGIVVQKNGPFSYERYNRPDVLYNEGDIISLEERNDKDEVIKEAILSNGTEVRVIGNMKFNLLRESNVGKMLTALIQMDIDNIKGIDTITEDLKQN